MTLKLKPKWQSKELSTFPEMNRNIHCILYSQVHWFQFEWLDPLITGRIWKLKAKLSKFCKYTDHLQEDPVEDTVYFRNLVLQILSALQCFKISSWYNDKIPAFTGSLNRKLVTLQFLTTWKYMILVPFFSNFLCSISVLAYIFSLIQYANFNTRAIIHPPKLSH